MTVEEFRQLEKGNLVIVHDTSVMYAVDAVLPATDAKPWHTVLVRSPGWPDLSITERDADKLTRWLPGPLEEGETPK